MTGIKRYYNILLIASLLCLIINPVFNYIPAQNIKRRKKQKLSADSLIEVGGWQYGLYKLVETDENRNYSFLTSGGVVLIFDISNPSSPVLISDVIRSSVAINDIKYDSATQHLYLSLGYDGIEIWDLQDISSPQLVGTLPNAAGAVVIKPGFLFFINESGGVTSANISDPQNPFIVNYYNPADAVNSLDIDDSGNYLAASGTSTYLFSIQPDGSITLVTYNLFFGGEGLHIHGNYIYEVFPGFQSVPSTLYVLQLSTLGHLNSITLPGNQTVGYHITSSANNLFISDRQLGVDIFSLSNPASPGLLATFPTGCAGLSYISNQILVADYTGMKIIDVSNPQSPMLTYSYEGPGGYARTIKVSGNYCYMLTDYSLYVFDISDPTLPELIGENGPTNGIGLDFVIKGSYAYVTNQDGFRVVDISDPSNPVTVWNSPPLYYQRVASEGNYLYMTTLSTVIGGTFYFKVFDISNPVLPVETGSISIPYGTSGIDVSDGYVYLTLFQSGMEIIDVSDPNQPNVVFTDNQNVWFEDVRLGGNYAYVTDVYASNNKVDIFDVSDPTNPDLVGNQYFNSPVQAWKNFVYGNVLFVGDGLDPYLAVVDIADPPNPIIISTQMIADNYADIDVTDNYVYLATQNSGIHIYENPYGIVPVELTSFTAVSNNGDVVLKWETATENNNKGFEILRSQKAKVKSQKSWERIGFVEGHGTTTQKNSYTYTDKKLESGRYSYKLVQVDFDGSRNESEVVNAEINTQPSEYALRQNYPNPFNPTTTIEYSIPKNGNVKIEIYNTLGEEIKEIVNGYKSAGRYKVNFNAAALSSGIYYYRIEANRFSSIKKMILLK